MRTLWLGCAHPMNEHCTERGNAFGMLVTSTQLSLKYNNLPLMSPPHPTSLPSYLPIFTALLRRPHLYHHPLLFPQSLPEPHFLSNFPSMYPSVCSACSFQTSVDQSLSLLVSTLFFYPPNLALPSPLFLHHRQNCLVFPSTRGQCMVLSSQVSFSSCYF